MPILVEEPSVLAHVQWNVERDVPVVQVLSRLQSGTSSKRTSCGAQRQQHAPAHAQQFLLGPAVQVGARRRVCDEPTGKATDRSVHKDQLQQTRRGSRHRTREARDIAGRDEGANGRTEEEGACISGMMGLTRRGRSCQRTCLPSSGRPRGCRRGIPCDFG